MTFCHVSSVGMFSIRTNYLLLYTSSFQDYTKEFVSCKVSAFDKTWRSSCMLPKIQRITYLRQHPLSYISAQSCWSSYSLYFIKFNPLNPELNPICYLLALLAHHFLHVSRIRVKSLTLRLLMSYIYIWSTYSWCF